MTQKSSLSWEFALRPLEVTTVKRLFVCVRAKNGTTMNHPAERFRMCAPLCQNFLYVMCLYAFMGLAEREGKKLYSSFILTRGIVVRVYMSAFGS